MASTASPLGASTILRTWLPLAGSWLLMGTEMSLVGAAIARLPDPEANLAAFGGVVFPMALLIEAPIIMMLAASTALSSDRDAFGRLLRFSTVCGAVLTALHAALAFTPLFDWVIVPVLGPPEDAVEPARLGMAWMLCWTWAIADRRLHQGLLIAFERASTVVIGTVLRLAAMVLVLVLGVLHGGVSGAGLAAAALSGGVLVEMVVTRFFARPVVRGPLREAPLGEPLTLGRLLSFYVPLAVTPVLHLAVLPVGAAGMARMPDPSANLAAWTPVNGLVFLSRSVGIAFNEVVVSLSGRPGARVALGRFAVRLGLVLTAVLLVVAVTPLSGLWFAGVTSLEGLVLSVATAGLPLGIALPMLTVAVSLYTGRLVHSRRTRPVPESVALSFGVTVAVVGLGIVVDVLPGVQMTLLALTAGAIAQAGWLWFRERGRADHSAPVSQPR